MLEIRGVSCHYDNVKILHDISFSLGTGENLAIIGPNGCGKTTLLKCVTNLIPLGGEIFIDDVSVKKIKRKEMARKIAMLSQITQIYFSYSVFETVMMGRYAYSNGVLSATSKKDTEVVESALEAVHITDLRDRAITTLSGGQLQRVFLAKTFAQNPDIILLDEPTNHLDLTYQIELIDYLKNWSTTNNKSVVGVLHDINLALSFADKVLLLKDGKISSLSDVNDLNVEKLRDVYSMDIVAFMRDSFRKWERFM